MNSIFLIPPKSKKSVEWPLLPNERRFTRVRAACDRCRIKKTKCDGTRPCARCRHDDAICVDNRKGDREPKMVSPEYVTMLEAQQEQLIKTLRKLHSQTLQSDHKGPGPSIQEILDILPMSVSEESEELPHKKARTSNSPENNNLNLPYNDFPNTTQQASTYPTLPDSDLINSLDIGQPEILPMQENLPELDPSIWEGLDLNLFNQWTMEPGSSSSAMPEQTHQGFPNSAPTSRMIAMKQVPLEDLFCDPRALSIPNWNGMGYEPGIAVDDDTLLRSYVSR